MEFLLVILLKSLAFWTPRVCNDFEIFLLFNFEIWQSLLQSSTMFTTALHSDCYAFGFWMQSLKMSPLFKSFHSKTSTLYSALVILPYTTTTLCHPQAESRILSHANITATKYFFKSWGKKKEAVRRLILMSNRLFGFAMWKPNVFFYAKVPKMWRTRSTLYCTVFTSLQFLL